MPSDFVRGECIGAFTHPYEFWTSKNSGYPCYLPPYRFARGYFENDGEAEIWVRTHYPAEYAQGIEMRCFDQHQN
jgi:hypothetical protein